LAKILQALSITTRHLAERGCSRQTQVMSILVGPEFIDAHGNVMDRLGCDHGRIFVPDGAIKQLPGALAVPGLCDSHLHLMGMGWVIDQVDLMGCDSITEVRERIREWLVQNPDAHAVRGRSWNHTRFRDQRLPCAADLEGLTDKPIYLTRQDGHACWVNQRLLNEAGIDDRTQDPFGGLVVRDGQGRATGVLVDTAMPFVARILPEPTRREVARWLQEGIRRCVSAGLTAVHDVDVPLASFYELERLDAAGQLPMRVFCYLRDEPESWRLLEERGFRWQGAGGRLTLMGIKFFADGALGSHGAAMLCNYCNDPSRGLVLLSDEDLVERITQCQRMGFQSATHAIGDAANRSVIRAIEAAQQGDRRLRHRIEHTQIVSLDDFEALAQSGAIASMQPVHGTSDMAWAEAWIGLDRLMGSYAWQRMQTHGVPMAFGSDAPVEPVCPRAGLQAAWTGHSPDGEEPKPWLEPHCLDFAGSLAGFTSGAAYAVHLEHEFGRFEPGFCADLTLLSADPRSLERGWLDVEVQGTVLDGESV
jgi:predicted amidohydrolase YtcJ